MLSPILSNSNSQSQADDIMESNEKGHGSNQHSDHLIRYPRPPPPR